MGVLRLTDKDASFIHIRRTGGTSVRRSLEGQTNTDIFPMKKMKHPSISHAKKHFGDLGFVFTTVRNPYDRLVSLYHHQKRHRYPGSNKPFKKYVLEVADFEDHAKPMCAYLDGDVDFVLRYETLHDDYKELCERFNIKNKLRNDNKSSGKKKYQTYYDEELQRFVYNKYREDFTRFGYSYEL
jgi:hypothetical protein